MIRCDEECFGGVDCPCYESGREYGEQEALLQQAEDHDQELMDSARAAIERIFQSTLGPLEDKHILKGDKTVVPLLNLLHDLQRKVLEVVE